MKMLNKKYTLLLLLLFLSTFILSSCSSVSDSNEGTISNRSNKFDPGEMYELTFYVTADGYESTPNDIKILQDNDDNTFVCIEENFQGKLIYNRTTYPFTYDDYSILTELGEFRYNIVDDKLTMYGEERWELTLMK